MDYLTFITRVASKLAKKTRAHESHNDHLIEKMIKDPLFKITEDGKVFSKLTKNGQGISKEWRAVGYKKKDGYVRFRYRDEFLFMHRVIYRKFKGELQPNMTVNHKDLDNSNNHPDNLELVTQHDNNKRKRKKYRKRDIIAKVKIKLTEGEAIDKEIKDLIQKLNDAGYETLYSCQGKTQADPADHSIISYIAFKGRPLSEDLIGKLKQFGFEISTLKGDNQAVHARDVIKDWSEQEQMEFRTLGPNKKRKMTEEEKEKQEKNNLKFLEEIPRIFGV